ncbi:MAG TPA: serine hydrolase domain-containing protein [Kiritimatiellia bacterium]|nr:serine hydrolase domain-containing protein [Kiritimatiellia bacterium]HPS08412.1 serine hydrolase domain-containing protein [Kiritimatiellia bacterium]
MTRRGVLSLAACAAGGVAGGCAGFPREEARFAAAREEMRRLVQAGLFAGAVAADADGGPVLAEGLQCFLEKKVPMTADSLCDLASVGKTFTASLCAQLVAEGRLDPDAPFTTYLPEHVLAKEKCRITVRDLATHSGGFDNSKPYWAERDPAVFLRKLYAKRPVRPRGEAFEYACSNFIYLGKIVEKLTGSDLDSAARKRFWGPLGMTRTTWNPVRDDGRVVEFPPSSYAGTGTRRIGDHNDLACHVSPVPLGSGSAFSTVGDMRLFAADLLHRRRFPKAYYDLLFTPSFEKGGVRRSFGWDMPAERSKTQMTPDLVFSPATIAHSGWTGPAVVVDPEKGRAGVFLGNRTGDYLGSMRGRMKVLALLRG